MYTTSKRIELESPGCSGLKLFEFATKPDQPGLSSLIHLEVVMEQSWYIMQQKTFTEPIPNIDEVVFICNNF